MRKFVYPAVLYYDKDYNAYTIAIHDLALFTGGETVEIACENAQAFLNNYIQCALRYNAEIPEATDFNTVVTQFSKNLVVLVECKIDNKNKAV